MKRRHFLPLLLALAAGRVSAAEGDPGKEVIGMVTLAVYFGTDGDPAAAGARTVAVPKEVAERFAKEERLRFAHYRLLGRDVKPLYRSYENWAQPLAPSDEVLLRFEAQSALSKEVMLLDLELWLSRKKIFKTDAPLSPDKPLLIRGPEWRGGRFILSIELAPGEPKA